jgi:DNA repair ATPase RecN
MPRIDPARFDELVRRRDKEKKTLDEAECALKSAEEAVKSAQHRWSDACNNLQDYVQDCAGDNNLGSYRR